MLKATGLLTASQSYNSLSAISSATHEKLNSSFSSSLHRKNSLPGPTPARKPQSVDAIHIPDIEDSSTAREEPQMTTSEESLVSEGSSEALTVELPPKPLPRKSRETVNDVIATESSRHAVVEEKTSQSEILNEYSKMKEVKTTGETSASTENTAFTPPPTPSSKTSATNLADKDSSKDKSGSHRKKKLLRSRKSKPKDSPKQSAGDNTPPRVTSSQSQLRKPRSLTATSESTAALRSLGIDGDRLDTVHGTWKRMQSALSGDGVDYETKVGPLE